MTFTPARPGGEALTGSVTEPMAETLRTLKLPAQKADV
jgi:hypothetical protein